MRSIRVVGVCLIAFATVCPASAQTTAEKRQALARVRRVLVVPSFFGTPTLLGEDPNDKSKKPPPQKRTEEQRQQWATYREILHKLEKKAAKLLPERLGKRTTWEVVSAEEAEDALKALTLTPPQILMNRGYLKGNKFPSADKESVVKLVRQAKVDALLLNVLDEPLKFAGGYASDGFNLFRESPYVRLRGSFIVVMADGGTVLSEVMTVVHPYSKRGKREYLLTDWEEAEEKLFENFMDELNRYTSPRP
ncbi:MAG: hypothetical protein NT023_01225 [Armatimonadetes bacterium]|nr:hypothetical protein [Armatimonadota bacterium]